MGLKANMSRIVGQNVEELDLPIYRGILANMSTNFWLVRADSYFPPEERVRLVRLVTGYYQVKGQVNGVSNILGIRYKYYIYT